MAEYKLVMPKMGESVIEATILTWRKKAGEAVLENEILLEVATDKVDSEVPCPVNGVIKQLLHEEGAVVPVGDALAIIDTDAGDPLENKAESKKEMPAPFKEPQKPEVITVKTETVVPNMETAKKIETVVPPPQQIEKEIKTISKNYIAPAPGGSKYYSPLVLNIVQVENISMAELEAIPGTGLDGRVTKEDILEYVEEKGKRKKEKAIRPEDKKEEVKPEIRQEPKPVVKDAPVTPPAAGSQIEIIEMDRMRKLISQHMVNSKNVSAHVASFVECDVTRIVKWRNKHKDAFKKRYGYNLTFMPVFVEAIAKAIKDFPMINVSVDGDKILKKRDINIGIATALPSGNLIVPVVRNADRMNLLGLAQAINTIVQKARTNSLSPDDISEGTYTISNIGTFGNIIGTPIINQPQVAIMAVGSITKKPVVIEVDDEDVIAIRHMLYLSHTYDHRVVDGMLGGMFVKKVADYLEQFDQNTEV
jgi:2-oxoglutarate dehydrogenase E2 component (dihydrolipoamide succinyltransferase)